MYTLFHHPFCPHSRFIRLVLGEHGLDLRLVEERVWERREAFLALNPAGHTPVLIAEGLPPIPGAGIIAEYLDEAHGAGGGRTAAAAGVDGERIEVRRLMAWFNDKFFEEASNPLVTERIYKRFMSEENGGGAPAADVIRAAKVNVRYHLTYIGWLARTRNYLAGDRTHLRGPRRRGASFGDRLSGRRAMERGRRGKGVVRAGEIPPVVPPAAERMAGGRAGLADLRGPRLLNATAKLSAADLKTALAREASALGFDCVGVTDPDAIAQASKYFQRIPRRRRPWRHGLARRQPERRTDPRVLWPGVRSIIMLGVNYGPDENPLEILEKRDCGAISVYAQGDDYHDLIKKRLKTLARWLVATTGDEVKVFVDTAAVMEKPLAQAAGLGWQGKHTNLVSREFGSWLFLGAIYSASDLPRDEPDGDHCGSCNACQDICPTAAFPAPYKLDARRCISYLTIENKGPIPHEFRKAIGNRIYGCDDCLAVCPWNKFAQAGREAKLAAREELRAPQLAELARLDDAAFRALFAKSPVKRIGRDRFIRNVLIAIGNSNRPDAGRTRPSDCSTTKARWCAARRCGRCRNCWSGEISTRWRLDAIGTETDEGVRAEWRDRFRCGDDSGAQIPSWSRAMTNQPFFTKTRRRLHPQVQSRTVRGTRTRCTVASSSACLAYEIEQRHGSDDFVPARLTVDMFRLPNIGADRGHD